MLSNRVILAVATPFLAYLAIYLGDGSYSIWDAPNASGGLKFVLVLATVISAVVAVIFLGVGLSYVLTHSSRAEDFTAIMAGTMACMYLFGSLCGPFHNYGPWPWLWTTRWAFLPVVALLPYVIASKDLAFDILAYRREKKAARANVVPLNRDRA